jgi:hypothetical protein
VELAKPFIRGLLCRYGTSERHKHLNVLFQPHFLNLSSGSDDTGRKHEQHYEYMGRAINAAKCFLDFVSFSGVFVSG